MDRVQDPAATGHALLARLSNAMVQAQKEYWGKGPTMAKSYLLDDFLLIVMRGGLTRAEETMLEEGEADKVRDFRQTFQNRLASRYIDLIEETTGRKVVTYQSQILFNPTIVVEVFFFGDPAPGSDGSIATVIAQLDERPVEGADAAT